QFSFTYKADVGNGLTEWEYDHVIFGLFDGSPNINKQEASDYKWVLLDQLKKDLDRNPDTYTPWLRICIDKVIDAYKKWGNKHGS
ncbi:MAG: isopentenyl-diphosphate Delta-isomerase, partial [Candidatus Micrarchaeia archaeon]